MGGLCVTYRHIFICPFALLLQNVIYSSLIILKVIYAMLVLLFTMLSKMQNFYGGIEFKINVGLNDILVALSLS